MGFEHYMYVVECADGTLYTGYSTDVEARVAAHNAGKGAKYTKPRTPVRLLAKARFFTKQRAMSAEARFKQLLRDQKDAALALAAKRPFEDVLAEAIPGFAEEPVGEFVARSLWQNRDEAYRAFNAGLLPSVDARAVVGVRTPALRKIARELAKRPDAGDFFADVPHRLFEESQLHAFAIESATGYDEALAMTQAFLPYVDNWATCDQLPNKALAQRPGETLAHIRVWIASDRVYTARYGMKALMQHYLDERFDPAFLQMVADKHVPGFEKPEPASAAYYLDMMRAWFFAEAMAKQPDAAFPYLRHPERGGNGALDEWTRRKAIQKSVESFRVPDALKERLRAER